MLSRQIAIRRATADDSQTVYEIVWHCLRRYRRRTGRWNRKPRRPYRQVCLCPRGTIFRSEVQRGDVGVLRLHRIRIRYIMEHIYIQSDQIFSSKSCCG